MISLLVTQILLLAAVLVAAKALRSDVRSGWASILAGLGLASTLVFWESDFGDSSSLMVSVAGAGLATVGLWLIFQAFLAMPIAGYLSLLLTSLALLPLWLHETAQPVAQLGMDQSSITPMLLLHIVLSVLAFAAFSLAAMQSVAVVWMSNKIKQHQLNDYPGAGSLEHNERAWLRVTQLAWALVALAVISGIPSVYSLLSQHLAHKVFFALLALVLLSVVLMGRRLRGWREKTAAKWVLGGWVAMILGWFGSKFALTLLA